MNRLFLLAAAVIILSSVGCKSLAQKSEKQTAQENVKTTETTMQSKPQSKQPEMLIGIIDRQQLEAGEFAKWFEPYYKAYEVNEDINIISDLLNNVDVTVFMGTWCPDSHREVPNFYKVMDALETSPEIQLIAVDRSKTTSEGLENGKNIQRVPTFIFTKNGKELGRIVEYPIESLEKDMIKILSGEDYKNAYAE